MIKQFVTHVAVVLFTTTDETKRNFFNHENILRSLVLFVRIFIVITFVIVNVLVFVLHILAYVRN